MNPYAIAHSLSDIVLIQVKFEHYISVVIHMLPGGLTESQKPQKTFYFEK